MLDISIIMLMLLFLRLCKILLNVNCPYTIENLHTRKQHSRMIGWHFIQTELLAESETLAGLSAKPH